MSTDVGVNFVHVPQHPPLKTDAFTEPRHTAAAERLKADEYFNFCLHINSVEADESPLGSVHEYSEAFKCTRVKGRLRSHVSFWKSIGASQFIIDTIARGYIMPFLTTPPTACFRNNKSALEHSDFVDTAITELITAGSIIECFLPPTVLNPLSVAIQSSGKKRLILDLRYPNSFLKKFKVKFEGAPEMLTTLTDCPQHFLFSFDIKSGYHHIDIFPDGQQFLGFSWLRQGVVQYFKFTVLPFGLATGPYIFTKVMLR